MNECVHGVPIGTDCWSCPVPNSPAVNALADTLAQREPRASANQAWKQWWTKTLHPFTTEPDDSVKAIFMAGFEAGYDEGQGDATEEWGELHG